MTSQELHKHLTRSALHATSEFKRLFHGRGGLYDGLKHLTIDSIDTIVSAAFYFEESNEDELIQMLKEFVNAAQHYNTLVIQKRYLKVLRVKF